MLKGLIRISICVAIAGMLVLGFAPAKYVYAQGGLTWTSSFQVYNPNATNANITLTYYNQSNGSQAYSATDVVTHNASKTYFVSTITSLPAGFNGSLVISSDVPLFTVNNLVSADGHYLASTNGFSAGATTFYVPLVMCNNSGFNTFFSVQNAGAADAHITVTYNPNGSGFGVSKSETATLVVGQSKTYDQTTGSTTVNCSTLQDPVTHKFVGGAVITSDQPVVAVGYSLNTGTAASISGFGGFGQGSTIVTLPLVMANNSTFWTAIQIQNVGTGPTNVSVSYGQNTAGSFVAPTNNACNNLAAGQSCTVFQAGAAWTGRYIGSATLTSSAQPIVAIVNQSNTGGGATNTKQAAYEGFDPALATAKLEMPLIYANNSGGATSFQIMNVGTGSCSVTVTYSPNTGGANQPAAESFTLAQGASKTVFQNSTPPGNGSANNWNTVGKYIGSAEAIGTPSTCKIVAVVNQSFSGGYDTFMSGDAFNAP